MVFNLFTRKMRTALNIIRSGGVVALAKYVVKERQAHVWKWRAERYAYKLRNSDLAVAEANGFKIFVRPQDAGISRELLYARIHEPQCTTLIQCFVRQGDVVLDIGANLGYYTLLLARLVGETGKVIAIEPNPDVFEILCLNLELNKAYNVCPYRLAIGSKNGEGVLYIREACNLSSLIPDGSGIERTTKVPVRRIDTVLDELGLPLFTVLRMDVEGFEAEIIEGHYELLSRYMPRMVVEYHKHKIGTDRAEHVLRRLESLGYTIKFLIPRDEDWPWKKPPARILRPSSISNFLRSRTWASNDLHTYTLFLDSRKNVG